MSSAHIVCLYENIFAPIVQMKMMRLKFSVMEDGEYVLGDEEVADSHIDMFTGWDREGASDFVLNLREGWIPVLGEEKAEQPQ